MRWELPYVVLRVQVHPLWVVQTCDLLVGVDSCQDTADISLKRAKRQQFSFVFCFVFVYFLFSPTSLCFKHAHLTCIQKVTVVQTHNKLSERPQSKIGKRMYFKQPCVDINLDWRIREHSRGRSDCGGDEWQITRLLLESWGQTSAIKGGWLDFNVELFALQQSLALYLSGLKFKKTPVSRSSVMSRYPVWALCVLSYESVPKDTYTH